jgi:poly-gamma-glutamate capsule biosynthesis protein CapA/YwtB (metallophosphatase superfamily)
VRTIAAPITRKVAEADLTMVNLETSISHRGTPEAKELEDPDNRYHFRTSPAALDVLAAAGVDVATMANNHGADYGPLGLQDTLRAIRHSPVHVVGVGENRPAAFTPYRVSVRGTAVAFFGADASFREGASSVWAAGPRSAGIAAAHAARPRALLNAVRTASRRGDLVVVYMHWGEELQGCPTAQQRVTARALARAGARIVVGSHAHVLLGSGWIGENPASRIRKLLALVLRCSDSRSRGGGMTRLCERPDRGYWETSLGWPWRPRRFRSRSSTTSRPCGHDPVWTEIRFAGSTRARRGRFLGRP